MCSDLANFFGNKNSWSVSMPFQRQNFMFNLHSNSKNYLIPFQQNFLVSSDFMVNVDLCPGIVKLKACHTFLLMCGVFQLFQLGTARQYFTYGLEFPDADNLAECFLAQSSLL